MVSNSNEKKKLIYRHFNLFSVSSTQIYLSNQMHKVTIYRRYAYQSPNHRRRWSFVLIIFEDLGQSYPGASELTSQINNRLNPFFQNSLISWSEFKSTNLFGSCSSAIKPSNFNRNMSRFGMKQQQTCRVLTQTQKRMPKQNIFPNFYQL